MAHGELAWLFLEPDTGVDHCPRTLLSFFKARSSAVRLHPIIPTPSEFVMRSVTLASSGPHAAALQRDLHCIGDPDKSEEMGPEVKFVCTVAVKLITTI